MLRHLIAAALVGMLAAPLAAVRADDAQEATKHYFKGQELLGKGDMAAAAAEFEAAAAKDPSQEQYAALARSAKEGLKRQKQLDAEKDPRKWATLAAEQRAFFYKHQMYEPALKLDEQRAATEPGPASTILVAESQFEVGQDDKAVEALQGIPEDQRTATSRAFLALGLARQQKKDDARELLNRFEVPKEVDPPLLLVLGRAYAVQGNSDLAIEAVTRSIELTPAEKVPAWKEKIRRTRDFSALFHNGLFQHAIQNTESKVEKTG